jgi:pyruvate/2-oxoglutarate dehydrogenase complex dihydrolipoamide acyltransferase (E2) component
MRHLELTRKDNVSTFRKMALGTWRYAYDPTVYGTLALRMDETVRYIEAFRQKTGRRLTITHLIVKAVGEALRRCPDANAILRWNRVYLRKHINISVLVLQKEGGDDLIDLSAVKVEDVDQKTLLQVVDELEQAIVTLRSGGDSAVEKGKRTVRHVPFLLMNLFLKMLSFVWYTLNIDLRSVGMPSDAFGSVVVTNVGTLGLDVAFAPLVPYTRVPIFLAPGLIRDAPVVDNGQIVVGKLLNLNATFDHRFIDGYHASVLADTIREMFERPFEKFDRL